MQKKELTHLGNKMKEKRMKLGYTQEQMAELTELSYSTYTKIENAIQSPSLDALIRISITLNESMDYLLFGKELKLQKIEDSDLLTILQNIDVGKLKYVSDTLMQLAKILKEHEEKYRSRKEENI